MQNEVSQTLEKYNEESFSNQPKLEQNALIQSKVFEKAIIIMEDTIEDMDIEVEQKGSKIDFLENKRGLPDTKAIEETIKLGFNKIASEKR